MRSSFALERLRGIFRKSGLRFVLIKGADLAYRLYPEPALRLYGDWDIWFHPDDCENALKVLKEDGWKIPKLFSDEHEEAIKTTTHHFSTHVREGHLLEPHFSLANFNRIDPLNLWSYTVEGPHGGGERVLSPELNLLMLTRHAASMSYFHANLPKLLADASVVMKKEKVDFEKLRLMAKALLDDDALGAMRELTDKLGN